MVDLLEQLFSVIWQEEIVPRQWREGLINPRRACAERVTVVVSCVCVCVCVCVCACACACPCPCPCPHTLFWQYAQLEV